MSFRILTPLTTNRMSRLIFITLLYSVVLILAPQTTQANRRSRLDLTAASTANANASLTSSNTAETAAALSNEPAKPLNNAAALPLKTEQSASSATEAVTLQQDNIKFKDSVTPIAVDTGKSAGADLSAEDEKSYHQDVESIKEQKEDVPTASFEDVEIVDSATQLAATGSADSPHSHEECDSEMLGFEIVTG